MKISRCGIKTKQERQRDGASKSQMKRTSRQIMVVTFDSCGDIDSMSRDYNHYRTVSKKLQGTNERTISLVTNDIYEKLNRISGVIEKGDLGENLTIDNLNYDDIRPASKLRIGNVEIQVTEAIRPCERLGNQVWSEALGGNVWWNSSKSKTEISELINRPGGRGWYCRVLKTGTIKAGDSVSLLIKVESNKTCG